MTNSNTSTNNNTGNGSHIQASGHIVHPNTSNCPNCHAYNVGRRCCCTVAEHGPKPVDTMTALNMIELTW